MLTLIKSGLSEEQVKAALRPARVPRELSSEEVEELEQRLELAFLRDKLTNRPLRKRK